MKNVLLLVLFVISLSTMSSLAKLETIHVGNHTVSMNIPNYPQYYISSTVLNNQEAITIKFNQSLLRTLFIGPESITATIYDYPEGRNETFAAMKNRLTNWGWANFPGNFTLYPKNMAGTTGIVIEHPYSALYNSIDVLDAVAYLDIDSSGSSKALLEVISDYDRVVTGAIIDSMVVKRNE